MKKEDKNKKEYCVNCNDYVNFIINEKRKKFNYQDILIEYVGKEAVCSLCGETVYNDDVLKYNQEKIEKTYKEQNEIITINEINEIMSNYNIGKRPLSLLLGFGEITITRYLNGYLPTINNSKLLKKIYNSPSEYYSILQMNKSNISEITFKKSEKAVSKLLDVHSDDKVIFELSKYIINKIDVTNMSLQKILYYIQMFYMAIYNKHAFNSRCNAWDYGPVFGNVYYKYKSFGRNIINDEEPIIEFDKDLIKTTDKVLKYFGCYTTMVLKSFTHNEDPWLVSYNSENKIIKKSIIKEYGDKIIKEHGINSIEEIKKYSEYMFNRL